MISDLGEFRRYRNIAHVALTIGSGFYLLSFLFLFLPNYQWAIILAVLGLIVGNFAFNNLEKAHQFEPSVPSVHDGPTFNAYLKTGAQVSIILEIHYPIEQDQPQTMTRIQYQVQRTLNYHLSKMESLSEDPYLQLDEIIATDVQALRQELGLDKLSLRTIDVKISDGLTPLDRGIYLGPLQ